ncbi:carboxypeptidase-like regulatory domain-containing protein [Candidatus Altiarchaeota archaeon]
MRYKRLILAITLLALITSLASAIKVNDLEISPEPVDFEKKFTMTAELSGYGINVNAKFYVDDINFVSKVGNSEEKDIVGEWTTDDWDLYNVKCGRHTATVELYISGILIDNESQEFDLGNVPVIEFDPPRPQANRDVIIKFRDRDSGNPIQNADVDISHSLMTTQDKRTDAGGNIRFSPDHSGKYTLKIDERDYCGELNFYAKKEMLVDGPRPEKPVIGEMITIAFPANSDIGIKVYDSNGEVYKIVHGNTIAGAANFTMQEAGEFILALGDISTRYWGVNKTLTIYDRDVPEIEVAPDKPVKGHPMTITITSSGQPLSGAVVSIASPDGVVKEYRSTSDGRVNYGDNLAIGRYEASVKKERYASSTAEFYVLESLKASIEPSNPSVRDIMKVIVRNQDNKLVRDALVSIAGTTMRKNTDAEGRAEFQLPEAREYLIQVNKENHWNTSSKVVPSGIIYLTVDKREVEVGGKVTVNLKRHDGSSFKGDIKLSDPQGINILKTSDEYTFTADKPGKYVIEASKANFVSNKTEVTAIPHPLDFVSGIMDGVMTVNVTSHGEPVSGLTVTTVMGNETHDMVTDSLGVSSFNISYEGTVTITANTGGNPLYDVESSVEQVARSYRIILLLTPIAVIIIISIMVIGVIQLYKRYFEPHEEGQTMASRSSRKKIKPGKIKPSGPLNKTEGSRLGNV